MSTPFSRAVCLLLCLFSGAFAQANSAPEENSLTLRDYAAATAEYRPGATQGQSAWSLSESGTQVSIQWSSTTGAPTPATTWHLDFKPPTGAQLTAGQGYIHAGQNEYVDAVFSVRLGPNAGPAVVGNFLVKTLTRDAQGKLATLHLTFRQFALHPGANNFTPVPNDLPLVGEVRIHVPPTPAEGTNRAPLVSAGPSQHLNDPTSKTFVTKLVAEFEDDLLPLQVPLHGMWSQVSGPGSVVFANPNAPLTAASFTQPGAYLLRYTISDGEFTRSSDLHVVLDHQAQTYRGYAAENNIPLGVFQLRLASSGQFTGKLAIGSTRLPLKGVLPKSDQPTQFTLRLPDQGSALLTLTRSVDDRKVSGTLQLARTVDVIAVQEATSLLKAIHQNSPYAGRYTWLVDLPAAQKPYAYGYGTATVSKSGQCRFTGHLADGRAITYQAPLNLENGLPLLWQIPAVEQFAGVLTFAQSAAGPGFTGTVPWLRPPRAADPIYPEGFLLPGQVFGQLYTPPAKGQNLLTGAPDAAALQLSIATPGFPVSQAGLTLQASNTITAPRGFACKVESKTGLFTGKLLLGNSRTYTYHGAFLQASRFGGGMFAVPGGVGAVKLQVAAQP